MHGHGRLCFLWPKTTSCLPSALRPQPFDGKYTRHLLEEGFFHNNRTPGSFGRLDTWKFSKFGHVQVVVGSMFFVSHKFWRIFCEKHLEHERSTGGLLYLWGYGAYGQLGFGFDDLRWGISHPEGREGLRDCENHQLKHCCQCNNLHEQWNKYLFVQGI